MKQGYLPFYGLLCILLFCIISCEKDPEVISESESRTLLDVSYGEHEKQKMDVYLPANRSTEDTKVLIYAHGGGFLAGDRKEVDPLIISHFVARGWAVVNISYRLVNSELPSPSFTNDIQVIDQVSDVSAAVDHVLAHAREWAINGHRIGVAGHSAGGTLALLYAYSEHNASGKVKAVANWAGALDLAFTQTEIDSFGPEIRLIIYELIRRLTGQPYSPNNMENLEAISPHYVIHTTKAIPVINIFPEHNIVGDLPRQDIETYERFTNRLNNLGIPNRFIQIDNMDHGFHGNATKILLVESTITYFDEYLK